MNRLFKIMPQHLHGIQVRTLRPLQSLHFVVLQPSRGGAAGVFGIIVLLQNPSSFQLEVTNRRLDILLQDCLVDSRIHDSILSQRVFQGLKHNNGTHTFQEVQLLSCQSRVFSPKVLGIITMFSGKIETGFNVLFCSARVFALELWLTGHFCPGLLLMVES